MPITYNNPILLHTSGDNKFYLMSWPPKLNIIGRHCNYTYKGWAYIDTNDSSVIQGDWTDYSVCKTDYDIAIEKAQQYLLLV